ncbi:hypothetical protein UP10_18505 [Bradyrhizobium sp. LTSPM299]|nr:hypothetical protein UP10_18505 [Bradyrhizobium sp. LTSPM299]
MAVGDGIEGAGIERDTGHGSRLTRPAQPGKPAWFPFFRHFISPGPMNQVGVLRVFPGEPGMFRPRQATKQNRTATKPFRGPAKTAGNLRPVDVGQRNDGPGGPDHRGPS